MIHYVIRNVENKEREKRETETEQNSFVYYNQ